jgi:hypothetical protein
MKKIALGFSVLACSFVFMGCPKKTPNVEPVADTETQSAIDAAWATYVISDIDQICAFVAEDGFFNTFYNEAPGQPTTTVIRDTDAVQKVFAWPFPTRCLDGRTREGSIFLYTKLDRNGNDDANANSRYYRDFGFVGRIQPSNYKVDGWLIELFNPAAPAYIYNRLTTDKYDPTKVKLTWRIAGKFILRHPSNDPNKNIVWDGELIKTLTNSTDKDIFPVSRQLAINWVRADLKPQKAAIVHYHGKVEGMTSGTVPYKMTIDELTPLERDFLCSSDPVAGVTTSTVNPIQKEEHHPFIKGIASFTTGTTSDNKYPRQIYFGNENDVSLEPQCDNTGVIMIKGNSYPVNFRK